MLPFFICKSKVNKNLIFRLTFVLAETNTAKSKINEVVVELLVLADLALFQ